MRKTEQTTRFQWFNWTFGGYYVPRRRRRGSQIVAGLELGPLQIMWTEARPPKQLHPRVRTGCTLASKSSAGGD